MKYLFTINEFSAIPFLWAALLKRDVYVLAVEAAFPPLQGVLQKLAGWAMRSKRAQDVMSFCPDLHHVRDFSVTIMIYDIFGQTEDWQNHYFRFDKADKTVPDYARAYKLATCNHMAEKQLQILLLDQATKAFGRDDFRIYGVQRDTLGLFEAYFGYPFEDAPGSQRVPNIFINFALNLLFTFYSLLWVIFRTRIAPGSPEKIFLMADYTGSPTDLDLLEGLAENASMKIMPRRPDVFSQDVRDRLSGHKTCAMGDGVLGFRESMRLLKMTFVDALHIFMNTGWCTPALFYQVAALPFRRVRLRALLNTYRPQFFWGRDPYNPEHIIRTQELNRVGAKHQGVLHGFGGLTDLYPMFRYITFDRFYVFGSDIYEKVFKDTWAGDMEITSSGSYGVTPQVFNRLQGRANNLKDIVVFTSYLALFENETAIAIVRALGEAFPDRIVRLQVRSSLREKAGSKNFIESCSSDLPNVIYTTDDLFDLIAVSEYAFSDPSTVIMESIQFGVKAFMIDALPGHKKCLFRNYPHLAVTTPQEAVSRIRDLESGAISYDEDSLSGLVAKPDRPIVEIIRQGMGLPTIVANSHTQESS